MSDAWSVNLVFAGMLQTRQDTQARPDEWLGWVKSIWNRKKVAVNL